MWLARTGLLVAVKGLLWWGCAAVERQPPKTYCQQLLERRGNFSNMAYVPAAEYQACQNEYPWGPGTC